jgi:nitrite reductase/ring-hydroxylating ferredoxin subunit
MSNQLGFSGYFKREIPLEDAELTHTGPGTVCGEYLRRGWQPIAMSSEVRDLPLAVRVLGEDLVLFRDKSGRLGLLHRHCCHRGASLEYGIILERGITCCYHGWHFDVDGTILETPAEPSHSPIKRTLSQGAYPVEEQFGIIFAWLGHPSDRPPLPVFDTLQQPETDAVPFSIEIPCNWLQVYENTQDPIHVLYLHTRISGAQFGDASGATQVIDYRETPLGMINVQTRRWGDYIWNRTVENIYPNMNQGGAIWESAKETKVFRRTAFTRWMVPIDDTHTRIIGWRFFNDLLDPDGLGDRTKVGKQSIDFIGQVEDRPYEERQRQPGDYEAQVSQRPIAIHALEHLATSDRGVIMLRQLIRKQIRSGDRRPFLLEASRNTQGAIPTFCQDTVWRVPPAEDEVAQLRSFGDTVANEILSSYSLEPQERAARLRDICQNTFASSKERAGVTPLSKLPL